MEETTKLQSGEALLELRDLNEDDVRKEKVLKNPELAQSIANTLKVDADSLSFEPLSGSSISYRVLINNQSSGYTAMLHKSIKIEEKSYDYAAVLPNMEIKDGKVILPEGEFQLFYKIPTTSKRTLYKNNVCTLFHTDKAITVKSN